jgi:metal-responsive CopG/Arc/MetJ family transcriptional regulator
MPKLEVIYDAELGSVKVPERLKTLLDGYCIRQGRTRSDVIRSALCSWLGADLKTVMDHMVLTQEENNGHGKQ